MVVENELLVLSTQIASESVSETVIQLMTFDVAPRSTVMIMS